MPFPQRTIDDATTKLIELGVARSAATEITDLAHHAVTEALTSLLRICSAAEGENVHMATALALKWLQPAARKELTGVMDEARKRRRHPDG